MLLIAHNLKLNINCQTDKINNYSNDSSFYPLIRLNIDILALSRRMEDFIYLYHYVEYYVWGHLCHNFHRYI